MSVDAIVYKVQPLTNEELQKICGMNVADLNELGEWVIKEYSQKEMSDNPRRFEHIKPFLKPVELLYTRTDYKACCVAHGMPEETSSYAICHNYGSGCIVSFEGGSIRLTLDDLDEFTTTQSATYYVVKRKSIDAELSNWFARSLLNELEEKIEENKSVDLSYAPIHLNAENCKLICESLVKLYDEDELFPEADLARFMIEIMRGIYNPDGEVFIEFQD